MKCSSQVLLAGVTEGEAGVHWKVRLHQLVEVVSHRSS